jgi:hypothetical protein
MFRGSISHWTDIFISAFLHAIHNFYWSLLGKSVPELTRYCCAVACRRRFERIKLRKERKSQETPNIIADLQFLLSCLSVTSSARARSERQAQCILSLLYITSSGFVHAVPFGASQGSHRSRSLQTFAATILVFYKFFLFPSCEACQYNRLS